MAKTIADHLREEMRRVYYEVGPNAGLTSVLAADRLKDAAKSLEGDDAGVMYKCLTELRSIK